MGSTPIVGTLMSGRQAEVPEGYARKREPLDIGNYFSGCGVAAARGSGRPEVAGSSPVIPTIQEDLCSTAIAHVSIAPRRSLCG